MRTYKNIAAVLMIIALSIAAGFVYRNSNQVYQVVLLALVFMFAFSLLARKKAWFKPIITSRYNIFAEKFRYRTEFDFSKSILFHKFVEVLSNSNYKVISADENKGEIFAVSPLSWRSWGENIYIDLSEENGKTVMDFCSACFFQVYSWGRNEQNYNRLLNNFEDSLII